MFTLVGMENVCCGKSWGIGFQTEDGFNSTLLVKSLWRLIDNSCFIFAKVIKERYFESPTLWTQFNFTSHRTDAGALYRPYL